LFFFFGSLANECSRAAMHVVEFGMKSSAFHVCNLSAIVPPIK